MLWLVLSSSVFAGNLLRGFDVTKASSEDQPASLAPALGERSSSGAGPEPLQAPLRGKGRRSKDSDADGIVKPADRCPEEAETLNQYKDDDGCPDALPQVEFVARIEDKEENAAALMVKRSDGTVSQGLGRLVVGELPGTTVAASAKVGACFGGRAEAQVPDEGKLEVTVPIGRLDAEIMVTVTDASGRPLDGAVVRYIVEDDACAPADTALVEGKGIHSVGSGPTTVFVTAPGYGVHQVTLTPPPGERTLVDARLSPTQVSLRDGIFRLAKPLEFRPGAAAIADTSLPLVGQLASLMLSNPGQRFHVEVWVTGSANPRLSQERADAVKAALVEKGVPAEALTAEGMGPLPKGQNETVVAKIVN